MVPDDNDANNNENNDNGGMAAWLYYLSWLLDKKQMHKEFKDVFSGTGCFKGTFLLQVKEESKPYQVPPRHMAYALQELCRD